MSADKHVISNVEILIPSKIRIDAPIDVLKLAFFDYQTFTTCYFFMACIEADLGIANR